MKLKILTQLAILIGVCLAGEVIAQFIPIPFPAGVVSMVLLLILLFSGALKLRHISDVGNFLLKNMAFFFIPAGVSIIEHIPTLKPIIIPFLAICLISTFVTFAVTFISVRITSSLMSMAAKRTSENDTNKL